jgi:hypothetical protein
VTAVGLTSQGASTLAAAEAEIQRRLEAIAIHLDAGGDDPFAAFAPWRDALDAYRRARHGSH